MVVVRTENRSMSELRGRRAILVFGCAQALVRIVKGSEGSREDIKKTQELASRFKKAGVENILRATNEARGEAVAVQAPVPVPIVVRQQLVSTPSPSPAPPSVRLGQLRRHDSDGNPHLFSTFPPLLSTRYIPCC
jgi:hypothetical protein